MITNHFNNHTMFENEWENVSERFAMLSGEKYRFENRIKYFLIFSYLWRLYTLVTNNRRAFQKPLKETKYIKSECKIYVPIISNVPV